MFFRSITKQDACSDLALCTLPYKDLFVFYRRNYFIISLLNCSLSIASLEFIMEKTTKRKGEFHKKDHGVNGKNILESLSGIIASFGIPEKSHRNRATKPRR